jgi:polyphosphate kinase 2 (PPK2 family)
VEKKIRADQRLRAAAGRRGHHHPQVPKGDLAERALWDDYQKAYEDVLSKTSTEAAPWYVIPGDQKWFRNLLISQILVDTLEGLDMRFPEAEEGLDKIVIED